MGPKAPQDHMSIQTFDEGSHSPQSRQRLPSCMSAADCIYGTCVLNDRLSVLARLVSSESVRLTHGACTVLTSPSAVSGDQCHGLRAWLPRRLLFPAACHILVPTI